jgi:hypothetical protein
MLGLDIDIIMHNISLLVNSKPVKHKLRRLRLKLPLKFKDEIHKQLSASFIEVIKYSLWVSSIMLIRQKDERIKMCMNYHNLNDANL